jgi:type IV secretory pathway VirB4 component
MPKEQEQRKVIKKTGEGSVQAYIEIAEIRDNILVMKDGSLRSVVMVSSINFDLKSLAEQEAIIGSYQNFLNSLNFPVQILMRSKRLDLSSYLNKLKIVYENEQAPFIKTQLEEYTNLITNLLEVSNIKDKKFYIVVPFFPSLLGPGGLKKVGFFEKIGNAMNPTYKIKKKEEDFQLHKTQLLERVELLMGELSTLGVGAAQLTTRDLVELFYEIYNMDTAQREKLIEVSDLTSAIIR